MSNYIYTNGELISADRIIHADLRRQIAANSAKAAYRSNDRSNKVLKGSLHPNESSRSRGGNIGFLVNNNISKKSQLPEDLWDFVNSFEKIGLYLRFPLSQEDILAIRALKNSGFTAADYFQAMTTGKMTGINGVVAKLMKYFYSSMEYGLISKSSSK